MKKSLLFIFTFFLSSLLSITISYASVRVGNQIPEITLPVLNQPEKTVTLNKIDAEYLYIDFWASWCIPCRISLPKLSQLAVKLHKKGFVAIGVNLDQNPKNALQFLQKYPTTFLNLSDPKGVSAELFNLPKMPSAFLVHNGTVIKTFFGYVGGEMDQLEELIK